MLKKKYIRDGEGKIIGSVTNGFKGAFDSLVRDEHEQISGWSSNKFHTTRDGRGGLVSRNTADPGLLLKRHT